MTTPPQIQHVVWDWNGTLLDDTALCIEIMNGLLAERGLPLLDEARYRRLFDFPVIEYYRRLGFDFSRDPFDVVGAEFIRRYEARRSEAPLQPRARETLAALKGAGFAQHVLSAYHAGTLETLLAEKGVRDFFEDVVGSDNVYAHGKLDQGREWIQRRRLNPSEVLLIGDTRHDFEVARAMGCLCLLVADGYHPREKLEPLGAPVVDDLRGVCEFLGLPEGS
ncbi:MAG: HAD family hydrolase [Kiritimatiellae bacterium]|nr:HAD family hydrolase [Kiritimatiellia bacterium]MDW8459266.1 HAD family hydrolase [Verrucomicrobiota bacterium]